MDDCILELQGISKSFGQAVALRNACFQLKRGEVHALMGENGAGKSTFIKIITGAVTPDTGTVLLDGKPIRVRNTMESGKCGIAAIYQHVTAFPDLSVTENVFMGQELLTRLGTYDWQRMHRLAKETLAPFSPEIDVRSPMSALSVAQQQMVEIAKALSRKARILILDEPTASLSRFECEKLYGIIDRLREDGVSMIFITHRFEDMYRVASRVSVLRDGSYIGTWKVDEIDTAELIKAMVGRKLDHLYPEKTARKGETVLRVEGLSRRGYFDGVSFSVRAGEVLAITGLVGAGRTEVCETLFGLAKPDSGKIWLDGQEVFIHSPSDALKKGIGMLPEDRLLQGLAMRLPIYKNVTAANLKRFIHRGLLREGEEKEQAISLCERLLLKAANIGAEPSSLSGGNQQKVVFAKLLNCDLKVLILDEPTKGVDIGAKSSLYEIIDQLAAAGYAVVMVSSEMLEILGMADRILVMSGGTVTATFSAGEVTQEQILAASLEKIGERK